MVMNGTDNADDNADDDWGNEVGGSSSLLAGRKWYSIEI
jgi:hypothetical protein